jgi:membrane AbrB-like protein
MTHPSRLVLSRRLAETLVLAAAGGAVLGLPGLPAGWLSGAILFTAAAALAKRPVYVPDALARVIFVLLGISLGAAVTPDAVSRIATWPFSMLALALAMSCSTFSIAVYLHRVHGWDVMSALFAAAPGALSQALALAADTSADLRSVAIVQSVRVLVLAVVMPLVIAGLGMAGAPPDALPMPPLRESIGELVLLVIVSTAAAMFAYRMRLPGGLIVGAMLTSGLLHGAGVVRFNLPPAVVIASFVGLGALIGSRFYGTDLVRLRELFGAAFGALAVGMTVAGLFAAATAWILSLSFADVLIAYAPGGLEAMTILAFALHLDPAFVGAHHLWRFLFVSLMMPLAVAYVARWRQVSDDSEK